LGEGSWNFGKTQKVREEKFDRILDVDDLISTK
jgi:hypothetical protein